MDKQYSVEELVRIACRYNNNKRPFLYVNPLQGKHIPVAPEKPLCLFRYMADMIDEKYSGDRLLLIAFAETATAVGNGIAYYSSSVLYCTQTTREKYIGAEYLYFTEDHSHATEQSLIINGYEQIMGNVDRILFVDDEVTTGNTIFHLIGEIKHRFSDFKGEFSIISILNSMTDERISQFEKEYRIECLYVCKVPNDYGIKRIVEFSSLFKNNVLLNSNKSNCITEYYPTYSFTKIETVNVSNYDFRFLQERSALINDTDNYIEEVLSKVDIPEKVRNVLVLGTEEFMFLPLKIAERLQSHFPEINVNFHATTRSPIRISDVKGYPLFSRFQVVSMYDPERITYVYNLFKYDFVMVITDAHISINCACERLKEVLWQTECDLFCLVCQE